MAAATWRGVLYKLPKCSAFKSASATSNAKASRSSDRIFLPRSISSNRPYPAIQSQKPDVTVVAFSPPRLLLAAASPSATSNYMQAEQADRLCHLLPTQARKVVQSIRRGCRIAADSTPHSCQARRYRKTFEPRPQFTAGANLPTLRHANCRASGSKPQYLLRSMGRFRSSASFQIRRCVMLGVATRLVLTRSLF